MSEADLDAREAKLREQLAQLKARRQQLEARKLQKLIKGKSADDTRRKILLGAMLLDRMSRDDGAKTQITAQLDRYLTRDDDRALFGLAPKPQPEPTP